MPKKTIADLIRAQERWIESCGGTLPGYVERYGSEKDPNHYGAGGEAIYKADVDALRRLQERAGLIKAVPVGPLEKAIAEKIDRESRWGKYPPGFVPTPGGNGDKY